MNVFDPTQGFNAFTAGAQIGGNIRQRQTEAKLAPMVASGDFQGASQYAASRGNLDLAEDYMGKYKEALRQATTEQIAQEKKMIEGRARLAISGMQVPEQELPMWVQSNASQLKDLGYDDAQIAQWAQPGALDHRKLRSYADEALSIEQLLKSPEYFAPTEIMTEDGPQLAQFSSSGGAPRTYQGMAPYEAPKDPSYKQVETADGIYEYVEGQPDSMRFLGKAAAKQPLIGSIGGPQPVTPFQEALDKNAATEYIAWTTGGGADAVKQLTQLGNVVNDLKSGKSLTGPLLGLVAPETRALFNQGSVDAQQLVEEVVQRNLRLILGAQFTQKEGDRLIARAYNPQLGEELNAKRLGSLIQQISIAAQQKQAMMTYLEDNGTMTGFRGTTPSIQSFFDALSETEGGANTPRKRRWDAEAGRMVDVE